MKVAMVSPLEMKVPPMSYGGVELVVSLLTEELVRRGHDVTLFASGDSVTSGKLQSICPTHFFLSSYPPQSRPSRANRWLLWLGFAQGFDTPEGRPSSGSHFMASYRASRSSNARRAVKYS